MANPFDYSIISFINQFCGKSRVFDNAMVFLINSDLFKGWALMTLFWAVWFSSAQNLAARRQRIVATFYGTFVAMFIVRLLVMSTHFRSRPILNKTNGLVPALGFDVNSLFDSQNSFPSDHATLFFSLATGMFFVSRKLGLFTLAYVILFVAFPRIYTGMHYPTDIIAGGLIGVVMVSLANMTLFRNTVAQKTLVYSETKPQLFYVIFFFFSIQIGTLFDSSRALLHFIGQVIKTT